MNEMLDSVTAAQLLGCTERHAIRMCDKGKLPGAYKDGGVWRIPVGADPRLVLSVVEKKLADSNELSGIRADRREQALKKLGLIEQFEEFAKQVKQNGKTRVQAAKMFAASREIGQATLFRWIAMYRREGLVGLVDRRSKARFVNELISKEAIGLFNSLFLDQRRPSVISCINLVRYTNESQGHGWTVPGDKFFYRYVERDIPMFVKVLHREGQAAYESQCAPYVVIDPDSIEPGSVWVGDHHQLNMWVRHRGKWVRPWVTAWMDWGSRTIVGWHISASPNQTTILLAFKWAAEKFGPPDSVKIDNGKDYDSECWTGTTKVRRRAVKKGYIDEPLVAGIYALLGIGVSFAKPYHPQSKPVERFFATVDTQFTKAFETYCGASVEKRPDYMGDLLKREKVIERAHSLEEFAELFAQYAQVYNRSKHTGRGMDGKAPVEVMETRASRRSLAGGVLDLVCCVWSKELKVGKNGVTFNKLTYGQFDSELLVHQGRKVRLNYDPGDLSSVQVYDSVTFELICIAEQNLLVKYGGAGEDDLRTALRQQANVRKFAKAFKESRRVAGMDLASLAIESRRATIQKQEQSNERKTQTIRPVSTPLDSQVSKVRRRKVLKVVRKAAGAEGTRRVLNLDFEDLAVPNRYQGVKLLGYDDDEEQ